MFTAPVLLLAMVLALAAIVFIWSIGSGLSAPANRTVLLPAELKAQPVDIASDGKIAGSLLTGRPGRGVLLLLHGIRGNRKAMVNHARFLNGAGFTVLLIDLRAHGESPGQQITFGKLEARDVQAALRFLRARFPKERIGVLGSSLGGAAAVLAHPPLEVDALVLEMVYSDIRKAVANRIAMVLGNWARPFAGLLTCQLKPRLDLCAKDLLPVKAIGEIEAPKLIIGGSADRHTTVEDTEALFAAARDPKELWMIEGARHQNLHAYAGVVYEQRIITFFETHLAGRNAEGRSGTRAKFR